jgi:acetyl esterase/lipase
MDNNLSPKEIDLYTPEEQGKCFPVVFYIHGGGWHSGGKRSSYYPCTALSAAGYVCVATTYSLSTVSHQQIQFLVAAILIVLLFFLLICKRPVVRMVFITVTIIAIIRIHTNISDDIVQHPAHVHDVAKSFQWTVKNISKFRGDPNNIIVMGHSAGGHLATLLSTNTYFLNNLNIHSSYIRGCISMSGIYSDERLKEVPMGKFLLHNAFGKRATYYDAFPIYNITSTTPPTILINGRRELGLKKQTLDYHYALKQKGVYVETVYFSHCDHWDVYRHWNPGEQNEQVLDTIRKFIQKVVQPAELVVP